MSFNIEQYFTIWSKFAKEAQIIVKIFIFVFFFKNVAMVTHI